MRTGLRLGLRVVPSGLSSRFVSGPVLSSGRARIICGWFRLVGCARLLVPGPVPGWAAGLGFRTGGPRVPRPGDEPFPQRGGLMLAEP